MDQLTAARIQNVRDHMRLECEGDWDGVIATFEHPRYELYGAGSVFDGEDAVRGYFAASRTPFPDQANEIIAIGAGGDTVLVEFWLTGTHLDLLTSGRLVYRWHNGPDRSTRSSTMNEAVKTLRDRALIAALDTITDHIDQIDDAHGGSPIERLILAALPMVAKLDRREHTSVHFLEPNSFPPDHLEASTSLYVSPQAHVGQAFDFAVFAYDHQPRYLPEPGWRRLVVETDVGPNEPLASEVSRSEAADSRMFFTHGQIEADPWLAASKIFDWASWSFGY